MSANKNTDFVDVRGYTIKISQWPQQRSKTVIF